MWGDHKGPLTMVTPRTHCPWSAQAFYCPTGGGDVVTGLRTWLRTTSLVGPHPSVQLDVVEDVEHVGAALELLEQTMGLELDPIRQRHAALGQELDGGREQEET